MLTRSGAQFQFTINISASILAIVSALVGDSIFTVVQLLWINLIMDVFASLGLATDHPSPDFLKRKPEPRNSPIVTITMWKMILGQAIYQLAVIFTIHYAGWDVFDPHTQSEKEKLQTLVFNIYVWMQFFNQHNCRRVDNKLDIWYQGVLRNPWFIGVQSLTLIGQFVIIFKGGEAFDTEPLSGAQWGWSMLFGILTIPLGALIRQFPDKFVASFFKAVGDFLRWITKPFRGCCSCFSILSSRKRREASDESRSLDAIAGERQLGNVDIVRDKRPISNSTRSGTCLDGSLGCQQDVERPHCAHETTVDLQALLDAARAGRTLDKGVLELHPKTLRDELILWTRSKFGGPPSQDPTIQKLIAQSHGTEKKTTRRRGLARAVWVAPIRPGQASAPRGAGLTWESFLRSKRR